MTTPNWQHHSNKEAKRTLKPQALRQAKKRRAALKAKLLAASVVLVGFASPAQALTWKEFWDPFTEDHHHHHHHYSRPRPERVCYRQEYREEYIPGNSHTPGYVRVYRDKVRIPCGW